MISINLNIVDTLILSTLLFLIGTVIKDKISIFNRICIPSPVIGGLLFCLINSLLRSANLLIIYPDTSLMPYFMSLFFTIIGIGINLHLVKKGGYILFKYWLLCGILAYCQSILSVILAKFLNIHPLLGLMCGTISMEGGHGFAAAFGSTIENLGVNNALSVGVAAATFGLLLGSLLGGPTARYLIEKYNLKPVHIKGNNLKDKSGYSKKNSNSHIHKSSYSLTTYTFFEQALILLLCLSLGELMTNLLFNTTKIILPTVVGCMFFAVIFRSVNDKFRFVVLNFKLLDFLGELSLGIFLTMALMSIDLFKLSNLFGPILIIVISQVAFLIFFAVFVCFKALGKNFDAAVIISGLIGHGLGATPNAIANMTSVSDRYGYSEKAFLVVPLVGAFLLDAFTIPCIIFFINILS